MGLLPQTEQNAGKLQISRSDNQRELQLWLVDQVTILAEAFSEELTGAKLRLYAEDLCDLPAAQLGAAFTRARRELKFFPKIAELRELAGASAKDRRTVEAEAAWHYANEYLRKWGVDRMALYSGGNRIEAPALPERVQYALRSIGGLWGLNQVTAESRPFVQKDFIEAYNQAPIAATLAPELEEKFDEKKLLSQAMQLADRKQMGTKQNHASPVSPAVPLKNVQEPMTDIQFRDRREMLRQQAARISECAKTQHSPGIRQLVPIAGRRA
jgi:hypothetical protein